MFLVVARARFPVHNSADRVCAGRRDEASRTQTQRMNRTLNRSLAKQVAASNAGAHVVRNARTVTVIRPWNFCVIVENLLTIIRAYRPTVAP